MKLTQTTLFGVKGDHVRIKKSSPIAKIAVGEKVDFHLRIGGEVTSSGHTVLEVWPKQNNNFGCDVAMITGVAGWVSTAALTRAEAASNAQGGEANGCVVFLLALMFSVITLAAYMRVNHIREARITVKWIHDPVCERCGQVLDGCHNHCFEEGCE